MTYQKILKDALSLSPIERIQLVEVVLQSLSEPNPDIERLWENEAENRYKKYKDGNAVVKDVSDVLKKYGR